MKTTFQNRKSFRWSAIILVTLVSTQLFAEEDRGQALKRAQYLLNATTPSDNQIDAAASNEGYNTAVRSFLDSENFYDVMLRYHERMFGTGLPTEYLDELQNENIDNKTNKFAQIECGRSADRFRCYWSSSTDRNSKTASCPASWEQSVSVFWYPEIVAWVCPSVVRACGSDLSRCFIRHNDQNAAANAELGTTEIFDSRFAVIKSLSKQSAGLATAIVVANYPYSFLLQSGLTAVDGAIAHFYRQKHHFNLSKLNPPQELLDIVDSMALTDTKFRLVNTGESYEQAGVLSTFGWLRRYEKNRTRANELYKRLLCRDFVSEPPRVFPADPGNLRTTPGCMGCHSTLDPLADFFQTWGEGGDLYTGQKEATETRFGGHEGIYLSDLADIIKNENAFSSCQVQNAWEYLMGRAFYREEAELRTALTRYFVSVGYSFKELLYAIATHPAFLEGNRSDATVGDPLEEPPLGEAPGGGDLPSCEDKDIDFATDIAPKLNLCSGCHTANSASRQNLTTEEAWAGALGATSINMMTSGSMPPGTAGPPFSGSVYELKETVRCWRENN